MTHLGDLTRKLRTRPAENPAVLLVRRAPTDEPSGEITAEATAELGLPLTFVDWDYSTPTAPRARQIVIRRPGPGREPVGIMIPRLAFLRGLARSSASIVVTRDVGPITALASLSRLARRHRRVVALVEHHPRHGGPATDARWKRPFRRVFAVGVAVFVANTPEAAAWLKHGLGVAPERIIEGWWLAGFPDRLQPAATRPHAAGPPFRLGFVGSLDERKRPDLVLDLAAALRRHGLDVTVDVLGTGPLEASLQARAAQPDLAGHATLTGKVPRAEVAERMAQWDVLLAPSIEDLTNRAVVEALSVGTPVAISSAVGTAGNLVVDGMNGVIVDGHELATWTAAITALLTEPNSLARLREGAARTAPQLTTGTCAQPLAAALRRVR